MQKSCTTESEIETRGKITPLYMVELGFMASRHVPRTSYDGRVLMLGSSIWTCRTDIFEACWKRPWSILHERKIKASSSGSQEVFERGLSQHPGL